MAKKISFASGTAKAVARARPPPGLGPVRHPRRARRRSQNPNRESEIAHRHGRWLLMDRPAPLSFATIPHPAFGSAKQHLDAPNPRKTTKADRRYQRAAKTAAELVPELPQPGEAVHALMLGTFDLCQVITATAKLLPDLSHLRIATLCYSKRNVAELCSLLETRTGLALTLLVSVFFREHNKALHEYAVGELTAYPNTTIGAARTHCKVVCFDMGPTDALVFEGSANLRTNKNREQLTVFRDRQLHDWHARWIDELVKDDGSGG